ncbi:HNH endonuclease family protein, partial [Acinetobacter baumannii]|uniref:HNH endonuclease family protein n=1 Tax=Acinetobacter baumannii TaxID=470 RepID=UPI001896E7BE
TETWRRELGPNYEEIHATWINRIGNLTVTGYNSTYSNASFERKLSMDNGFNRSPYRINEFIRNQERWGAEQIEARTHELASTALEYWKFPETDFEPPAVVLPTEPLGTDTSFRHRVVVAYEFGDVKETVRSWSDMLPRIIRILLEQYRT